MPFVDTAGLPEREPLAGWTGRFFNSEHLTFAYYDIADGATALHEHHHEQEEVWHVTEGKLALTVDGEERVLGPGGVAVVPANHRHSARPVTACRAIVVDYPLRESIRGIRITDA